MTKTEIIYPLVALLLTSPIVYGMYTFIKEKEDKPVPFYSLTLEEYEEMLNKESYKEGYIQGYADGLKDKVECETCGKSIDKSIE